jgi:hypothetical protein
MTLANGTLMARERFGRYSGPVGVISMMAVIWGFGLERAKVLRFMR